MRAYYRLRSPRPERVLVPTPDGTRIAVHHRRPEVRRFVEPVLLCHGLAANHVNFDFDPPHSLAHVLAAAGFEVFSVDWRGAGASRSRGWWRRFLYDADDLIAQDGPALLAHALRAHRCRGARSGWATRWVRSSATACWAGRTAAASGECARSGRRSSSATPAGWPGCRAWRCGWPGRWPSGSAWLSIGLVAFLGHVTLPLTEVLLNPRAIAPRVLRKMYCNLVSSMGVPAPPAARRLEPHDAFRSRDGSVDYRARLAGGAPRSW